MLLDASLGVEKAGILFPQGGCAWCGGEDGIEAIEFCCGEEFMGQTELLRAGGAAGDELTVGVADHEAAGGVEEGLAGVLLELAPQIVGAKQERDIAGIFPVGLANDACLAVRGAEGMGRVELVEREDAMALHKLETGSEMIGGGAAHGSQADDDYAGHGRLGKSGVIEALRGAESDII